MLLVVAVVAGTLSIVHVLRVFAPSVFFDELVYMEAARSLVHGDGLAVRGGEYGYAPLFPVLAAAVIRVFGGGVAGYHAVLVLNALVVVSSVAPVWLMARRVLPSRAAGLAAAATLALPVALYAGYFMADAVGYTIALWALLAIQLAAERPTATRQAVAVVAVLGAVGVRFQFAVLVPTLVVAIVSTWLLGRDREPTRAFLVRLWPLGVPVAIGLLFGLGRVAAGDGSAMLGSYGVLWQGYDVLETLRWSAYHVFDLVLYVLLLPALCLPYALVALWRRARRSPAHAALLATLVSSVVLGILIVGLFSTTTFAEGRLHDRYLGYLVPMCIVALAWWWSEGMPRARAGAVGVAAIVAVVLLAPFDELVVSRSALIFDAVSTSVWASIANVGGDGVAHVAMLVTLGGLVALAVLGSEKARRIGLLACLGLSLVVSLALREGGVAFSDRGAFTSPSERTWVDAAVGQGRVVTSLLVVPERCPANALVRTMLETEFFNGSIGPVIRLGPALRASTVETVGALRDGSVVDRRGRPVLADLVLAPPGMRLQGVRRATGTVERLGLWDVRGPVRVVGAADEPALFDGVCRALRGLPGSEGDSRLTP